MIETVKYIDYLKKFNKRLEKILRKIETNKSELTDKDREIIDVTLLAYKEYSDDL